jgi:hypothetical protein
MKPTTSSLTLISMFPSWLNAPRAGFARGNHLKLPDFSTSRPGKKVSMRFARWIPLAALFLAAAAAADRSLLIQLQPDGRYRIWHSGGENPLSDDEALALAAAARPEGSAPVAVAAGRARAYDGPQGVVIALEGDPPATLLVDRDDCGAIKLWRANGAGGLSEEQLTDLVLSALPGGGRRLTLGNRYGKAYIGRLGYTAVLWPAPAARTSADVR